jgi:hypothetical protein
MHNGHVDTVHLAVVVEVAAAPITALVAEAHIAKAVVDAAIEANVWTPIATVEAIAAVPEAPVSGSPESADIGSLHPNAGHPVVAGRPPGPIAGRPKVSVAGSGRLLVFG